MALIAALENHTIADAALDVFEDEPRVSDALKRLDNVVITPHVAGFTPEAFRAGSSCCATTSAPTSRGTR